MADTTRILSRSTSEEPARVPANGDTPRVSDTLLDATKGPDADHHPEAAANAVADSEAGAGPEDGGGIVPLKRRD